MKTLQSFHTSSIIDHSIQETYQTTDTFKMMRMTQMRRARQALQLSLDKIMLIYCLYMYNPRNIPNTDHVT